MVKKTGIASRVPGLALLALGLAVILWGTAGGPIVPLWSLALIAIAAIGSRRSGWAAAIALSVGSFLVSEYVILRVSGALGVPLPILDLAVWGFVVLAAGVALAIRPLDVPDRARALAGAAAATGAVIVTSTVAVAQVLPGALRVAWGMNGDFVNTVVFARRMLADGGIDPSSTPQPTALPFAMMAANASSGRGSIGDGLLLEHDVLRSLELWIGVIAVSSFLAALIIARSLRGLRPRVVLPLVALASCGMLTWHVIGVQLQFGFINSAFAILALLASWIAYSVGEQRPATGLAGLFLLATVVLAVWSPLVICVAALGLALIVRERKALRSLPTTGALAVGATVIIFLIYAALVVVPMFLESSDALGSNGGFPLIGPASIMVVAALTVLLAVFLGRIQSAQHSAVGALAFVFGLSIGIVYLLIQRAGAESDWGYYVAKFAWTGSVILLVLCASMGATIIQRHPPRTGWDFAAVVAGTSVVAALLWTPATAPRPAAQFPLLGVLEGNAFGLNNRLSDAVFALSGTENGRNFLWRSSVGDFWPNFWLLQVDLTSPDRNPIRSFAHYTNGLDVAQVCEIVGLMGDHVTIHTADPSAASELAASCPAGEYRVVMDGY